MDPQGTSLGYVVSWCSTGGHGSTGHRPSVRMWCPGAVQVAMNPQGTHGSTGHPWIHRTPMDPQGTHGSTGHQPRVCGVLYLQSVQWGVLYPHGVQWLVVGCPIPTGCAVAGSGVSYTHMVCSGW